MSFRTTLTIVLSLFAFGLLAENNVGAPSPLQSADPGKVAPLKKKKKAVRNPSSLKHKKKSVKSKKK